MNSGRIVFALVFLFVISGCMDQSEPEVYRWDIQSQAVATTTSYLEIQNFVKSIEAMSAGRLIITPHPAGELAHGSDIYTAVSENRIQMGNGWPNWWSAQHPAWAVMNSGPFDFMNIDASMMFFYEKGGIELANELSIPQGVLWRPAWWAGMEFGLVSNEPITGLDDLKGKKVRIGPGLPSEVLVKASQSMAIPLVPEEIKPSLESGHIDAVEWTTSTGIIDLGLMEISAYGIVPAIWQPSVLADFLINKEAYDALPNDLQAILESAIKSYALTTTLKAKVNDIAALTTLEDHGMTLQKWSPSDIERWRVAATALTTQYKQKDDFSRRLIDSKQKFKQEFDYYYQYFGPYE